MKKNIYDISAPKDYRPYNTLIICGNTFINVKFPILIDGEPPLLIGEGDFLKIWLNIPGTPRSKKWNQIIRANRSLHESSRTLGIGTQDISVRIYETVVLKLFVRPDSTPQITLLDFRPVGLKMHGDSETLIIGTNQFVGNTFQGVGIIVGEK